MLFQAWNELGHWIELGDVGADCFVQETVHCLNLGSYNYLGFAGNDPYCTPKAHDT